VKFHDIFMQKLDNPQRRTVERSAFAGKKVVCDLDLWSRNLQNSQSAFSFIFGLAVTSIFDFLPQNLISLSLSWTASKM